MNPTNIRLPDVIYIGNMRAGSSYLRSYFGQHPDIVWTRRAWYFQLWDNDEQRQSEYIQCFENIPRDKVLIDMYEATIFGYIIQDTPECDYRKRGHPIWEAEWAIKINSSMDGKLVVPDITETARRIKAAAPEAKILIVIRNQIDWLRSMYLHHFSHYPPDHRGLADAASTIEGKTALATGLYDQTIDLYFSVFGGERVKVILLEEIQEDEASTLKELCNFLNVAYHPNDPAKTTKNERIHDPKEIKKVLDNNAIPQIQMQKPEEEPDIFSDNDKRILSAFYATSNLKTSILLNKDISRYGYPL